MIQSLYGAPIWTSALTQFQPASMGKNPELSQGDLFDPNLLLPTPLIVEFPPRLLPAPSLQDFGGFSNQDLASFGSESASRMIPGVGLSRDDASSQDTIAHSSEEIPAGTILIGSIPISSGAPASSSSKMEVPSISP